MKEEQRTVEHGASACPEVVEEGDLLRALAQNDFTAHFQPVVLPATGRVIGLEALARWRRSDGRLLEAKHFLDAARRAGLVSRIDRRTMTVAGRVAEGARLPPDLEWISVNVGPESLREAEFRRHTETLGRRLKRAGLGLVVEISQRATEKHRAETTAWLEEIRASGVRVALDDYGTMPFLLDRVLELPLDFVKIDVRPPPGTSARRLDQQGYIGSLARVSRSLGRAVVLEGVEAPPSDMATVIRGADLAQGYYFGRPHVPGGLR